MEACCIHTYDTSGSEPDQIIGTIVQIYILNEVSLLPFNADPNLVCGSIKYQLTYRVKVTISNQMSIHSV